MHLTLPQIIMIGHAATINHARMEERIERDRKEKERKEAEQKKRDEKDPIMPWGKRLSESTSEEIAGQFGPGKW